MRSGIKGSTLNLNAYIPQSLMLSAYHTINDMVTIMGNFGWQQWLKFQRGTVTFADANQTPLELKNKYEDIWHAAAALEMRLNKHWLASAGLAYASSGCNRQKPPLGLLCWPAMAHR